MIYGPQENVRRNSELKKLFGSISDQVDIGKENNQQIIILGNFNAKIGNCINPLSVCDIMLRIGGTCRKCVWRNITQIKCLELLALCLTKFCIHGPTVTVKFNWKIVSVNKIKRITYLTNQMAEKRQVSRTSDGAVKITRKKRYQLGIENVSLKGLRTTKKPSQREGDTWKDWRKKETRA